VETTTSIYIQNEYTAKYYSIVSSAETRPKKRKKSYHLHHIIPRSIRPDMINDKDNIVSLTIEEHIECHRLLPLMLDGIDKKRMEHALWFMTKKNEGKYHSLPKRNKKIIVKVKRVVKKKYKKRSTAIERIYPTLSYRDELIKKKKQKRLTLDESEYLLTRTT